MSGFFGSTSRIRKWLAMTTTWSSGTRRAAQMAPGLPLSGVQSGPTAQISISQSSFGSAMQSASDPPHEGRKPYFSTRPAIVRTASRAVAHRSRAKACACSTVMICRVSALDVGDVELGPLRAGALADGQLALVHLRIAGVEVGEGLLDLRDLADRLAELAEGQGPAVVARAEVDHAPVDGRFRALREGPAGDDLDAAFAAAVRVRRHDRAVGRGQAADADDRATFGRAGPLRRPERRGGQDEGDGQDR